MGVYRRKQKLWFKFKGPDGVWLRKATQFVPGQEAQAELAFRELTDKLQAGAEVADVEVGVATVRSYGVRWLDEREARGVTNISVERARMQKWVFPALGARPLSELRPKELQAFVRGLRGRIGRRGDPLAPRTIRKIWEDFKAMLKEAVADEVLVSSPAVLKRGDLPPKVDADPTWRSGAVFTRGEVESLISDDRIPEDRRLLYALYFLTGVRSSEGTVLRWRDYDAAVEPLGRISVSRAYDIHKKQEKATKTEQPRYVPVHRTLAAILAEWRMGGWVRQMERQPGPDDLIIPSRLGKVRSVRLGLTRFHEDQDRLGQRHRRLYDSRRTFISLALGDGARKDLLKWVTHPPTDQFDAYTTVPWAALCDAVSCLKIERLAGKIVELPARVVGDKLGEERALETPPLAPQIGPVITPNIPESLERAQKLGTPLGTPDLPARKNPVSLGAYGAKNWRGVRDSKGPERLEPTWC